MSRQFDGKVAYVTGAGSGIGAEIAVALAAKGAAVALIGRRETALREVESRITCAGGRSLSLTADVSNEADVARTITETCERLGGLHLAVNNAGTPGGSAPVADLEKQGWDEVIGINLSGIYLCMRHEIAAMRKVGGGAIVNISSVFTDRGLAGRSAYSSSKHAIRGLTRSVALELAKDSIRVNEVQPGVITVARQDGNPDEVARIAAGIPMGRTGTGSEVAAAVCFLLSDEASYITGSHLAVDGGFLS